MTKQRDSIYKLGLRYEELYNTQKHFIEKGLELDMVETVSNYVKNELSYMDAKDELEELEEYTRKFRRFLDPYVFDVVILLIEQYKEILSAIRVERVFGK